MKKEQKSRLQVHPDGQRIASTVQHENRFDRPQVKA